MLLARLTERATYRIAVEILYTGARKPTMPAKNNMRLSRLNSATDFALAARILGAATECVLLFDARILAHPHDIWQLLGFAERHALVCLYPRNSVGVEHESAWHFALRAARFDLAQFVGASPTNQPAMFAFNLPLLQKNMGRGGQGFLAQKYYADLLRGEHTISPLLLRGKSRDANRKPLPWLALWRNTVSAYKIWRDQGLFPYWFSYKSPLFLVAQAAFYLALLVVPLSLRGSLLLASFAVALTLPFYLHGAIALWRTIIYNRRAFPAILLRVLARTLLYLIG